MKKCFKCCRTKPLSEFYWHPRMKDGHLNKCKECTKRDVRVHRIVSERPREYDRERYQSDPRRRRAVSERSKVDRKNNPAKYRAKNAVNNAVRDGRLLKPKHCQVCKLPGRLHGHHDDYNKPLEVMWLCPRCHHGRHANERL